MRVRRGSRSVAVCQTAADHSCKSRTSARCLAVVLAPGWSQPWRRAALSRKLPPPRSTSRPWQTTLKLKFATFPNDNREPTVDLAASCRDPLRGSLVWEPAWNDRHSDAGALRHQTEHLRARHENDGSRRSIRFSVVWAKVALPYLLA